MMNFQFEAFGQKLSFEGNDVNAAYARANKFFAAVLDQGAWFDRDAGPGVLGFRWQVGNFFD